MRVALDDGSEKQPKALDRTFQDDNDGEDVLAKRIDIRYDNEVDSLGTFELGLTGKPTLTTGALWKYRCETQYHQVLKMDKACRACWNAYVWVNQTEDNDLDHFIDRTRTLVHNNVSFKLPSTYKRAANGQLEPYDP